MFTDMNELCLCVNGIKFTDKKKTEIKDTISENIKKVFKGDSVDKLNEDKNKKFNEQIKLNGKTTIYHTAEKDKLSKTMSAFYFSDKSKQVFSDKQTAEYKAMHFDTGYDISLEASFKPKEEDNSSSMSNLKGLSNVNVNNNGGGEIPKNLKRKRKSSTNFSCKPKTNKKRKQDKTNGTEDYNNKKNENDLDGQDGQYCIPHCKYNRISNKQPMIACDKCNRWYHFKCLAFTNEQYKKYEGKGKMWYCPSCKALDNEDKKLMDVINNSSKN